MKRIIAAAALICIALVFLLEPLGLAWMSDNGMSSPIDITSNVHKAYFESGDGTSDLVYDEDGNIVQSATGPYEIKYPLQLYYFAWLQYLGYFNTPKLDENGNEMKDENGNVITNTVYFYLSADLDMNTIGDENVPEDEQYKYVLPPVGTLTNPFLGNFDGQGHTIKDLTVENVKDNLTERPNNTDKFGDEKEVEIVGFFGVVGELAEGDYSYATQANEVKNLVLENLTVTTLTNNALIGLVAGYVNGFIDCVGVVGSTVNIKTDTSILDSEKYTENLSDYSLIGYCTEKFKDSVYIMDVMLTNPDITDKYNVVPSIGEGETQGWGGSIAMKSIFDMMDGLDTTPNADFITERTDVVTIGDASNESITVTVTQNTINSRDTATLVDPENQINFGSFVFNTQSGWNNNVINFVGGSTKVTQFKYAYKENDVPLYYITDGTNYLCFNGTDITNTTNQADATKWYVSNGTSGGVISTVVNGSVYYLTITDGSISVIADVNADPSNLPSWSVSGNSYSLDNQKIACENGVWIVDNNFQISYNNNYITNNGTNALQNVTNANNACSWKITSTHSGYTISTVINNTTYYLGYNTTQSGGWGNQTSYSGPTLTTDVNNANLWHFENNQLYLEGTTWWGDPPRYYLRYNNGNWTIENNTANATLTFTSTSSANVDINASNTNAKEIVCQRTEYIDNATENYYYNESGDKVATGGNTADHAGITYIPLSFKQNGNGQYYVSGSNTGYIVGSEWDKTTYDDQDGEPSNLRISEYQKSNITSPDKPYVISYQTENKFVELKSGDADYLKKEYGLVKYADCYGDYITSLADYCYGLHFMDAPILKENVAEITAHLNGKTVPNYQIPTNCINFNLYDRGFINAFAGTYYSMGNGNTSFFSLYEIFREDPKKEKYNIVDIKEISIIYGVFKNKDDPEKKEIDTSKAYIYKYTDGTYKNTDGTISNAFPDTGDLVYDEIFNCDWIMHTKTYCQNNNGGTWATNRAYYFEIPVNAGEYAIGSTQNETGAYLVYLDLAANAQLVEREKQYEEITETQSGATLPNGVELLEKAEGDEGYDKDGDGKVDVNPADSSFVSINGGASGSILFEKTDENTITHTANGNTSAEYIGAGNTLMNGTTQEELPQSVQKVTKIERTTYRDHNLNTGNYIVTVITKTTVTYKDGTSEVKYTKQVTTTDADGNVIADETHAAKEVTEADAVPAVKDKTDSPPVEKGANLLNFGFAYGQEFDLTLSYEYIPAGVDENGSATAPTYRITVNNPGDEDVIIKAMLTDAGEDSDITFVIVDGNGNAIATLDKTADVIQSITVKGTKATTEGGEGTDTPENGEGTEGGEDPAA